MEDKFDETQNNNDKSLSILYMIFKIISISIFMIFMHQILKQINISLHKNEKIYNINNNSMILVQNTTDNTNNSNINKSELIHFIRYESVFFNSFDLFKIARKKYFNIISLNYSFSTKFKLVKLEYILGLYDQNQTLLIPSDLSLYNELHFSCFLETEKYKKTVNTLPDIYLGKYLKCTEIFYYGENIKFGLTMYKRLSLFKIYFFSKDMIDYNDMSHLNDSIFDPSIIRANFSKLVEEIKSNKTNKPCSLKKAYLRKPIFDLRRNLVKNNSLWLFRNFYNEYYCYCIGNNCFNEPEGVIQTCKFLYYIVIIDKERYLYPKTEYIFVDFIFKSLTADDTYPVFQEMIKQNYPVHYITEKEEIISRYCANNSNCQTIIPININTYFTYGDFFEKYLPLVLRTKAFISCKEKHFHRVGYLFYRIEYITYIAVGHGVCYFKDYLFDKNRIYGSNRNNKIVIPPNDVLVKIAVDHGWKEENIIKLNLPRWDRYNNLINTDRITDIFSGNITNNSILVMFTWRMNKEYWAYNISSYYMKNMTKLLLDKRLKDELKTNNITLYVSFHRYIKDNYQQTIKKIIGNNENIKIIEQNDLAECLSKSNLVISDFSSVIFDLMYREKPFIIYIPDSGDPELVNLYSDDYIQLIDRMNNGTFKIENKCNNVDETVDKIIFYIRNKFTLDNNLKNYFKYFDFKHDQNIDKFINYLLSLE